MLRAGSAAKELVPGHVSAWPKSMQVKVWPLHSFLISESIGSLFEPIGISRRPLWHHWAARLPNVAAESTYASVLVAWTTR